jgi:hypothetical protein
MNLIIKDANTKGMKSDEINPDSTTSTSSLKSTSSSSGHLSWNEFLTQGDLLTNVTTSSTSSWQWRFYDGMLIC